MNKGQWRHKNNLYFQIGLHVASLHPDIAADITAKYLHTAALDEDLTNVAAYRETYESYLLTIQKPKSLFDVRRLFVSAMLRIFTPGVYNQSGKAITMSKYGFVRAVARGLRVSEDVVQKLVRKVIVYEKIYDDYRAEVKELVSFLTSNVKAKAC